MNKIKFILKLPHFWLKFIPFTLLVFALETFMFGLWKLPIIGYRVAYMTEVAIFDYLFIVAFALIFGFGLALFFLNSQIHKFSCATGSLSGLAALFTLLCPICPIFFLTYFGLSATLFVVAPYFWWFRTGAVILASVGVILLVRHFIPRKLFPIERRLILNFLGIVLITVLFLFNQTLITKTGMALMGPQPGDEIELSGDFSSDIAALVTPTSASFYGPELGLDFSNEKAINKSIEKLAVMAPKQGKSPIPLNEEEMKRYIAIGTEPYVACEFCCGATTLVTDEGDPTCGCAHSIAMRGTAAYLIRNYPDLTSAEIAYELMRQKGLYFPKQMQERMAKQLAGNSKDFTADIKYLTQNLSQSELSNLQKTAKSSGFTPDSKTDMVGGC